MHEGAHNGIESSAANMLTLGPNRNLQGGIRHYSMTTRRILQRQWQDSEVVKMPVSVISRANHAHKQQKAVKGFKLGNRQNLIDESIRIGVTDYPNLESPCEMTHGFTNHAATKGEDQNEDADEHTEDKNLDMKANGLAEDDEIDAKGRKNEKSYDMIIGNGNENLEAVENRSDEIASQESAEGTSKTQGNRARSGRISKLRDHATKFTEIDHVQMVSNKGRSIKPCYHDDSHEKEKLSSGALYQESCFSENMSE